MSGELANIAARKISGFGTNAGTEQKPSGGTYSTAQTMFLSAFDVDAVVDVVRDSIEKTVTVAEFEKVKVTDLQSLSELRGFRPITVDIALFGRMITSDAFKDVDSTTQVAHAISTHRVDNEYDYFTAVDDLQGDAEDSGSGADMIGDIEFNSACYYKYFSVDFNGLVRNLTGESLARTSVTDQERNSAKLLAAKAVLSFIRSAILVTPSGKQNTFAAHQLPALVLVEVRPFATPVSYANAFVKPVSTNNNGHGDIESASLSSLAAHIASLTNGFNLEATQRLSLAPTHKGFTIDGVTPVADLRELSSLLEGQLING